MNNNQEIYHIPMLVVGGSCRNNGWGWIELIFATLSGLLLFIMELFFWSKFGLFGFCSVGGIIALIIYYLINGEVHKNWEILKNE